MTNTAPNKGLEGPTHIIYVIDKSGSMAGLKSKTIEQFNSLLRQQKEIEDGSFISIYQFDVELSKFYSRVPLAIADYLNNTSYMPSGGTALLDALGSVIYDNLDFSKTYLCILTDGQENASQWYNKETISLLVNQQEELGWDINYIGSDMAGFAEAGKYGFKSHKMGLVANSAAGLETAYASMNKTTANYRSTGVN